MCSDSNYPINIKDLYPGRTFHYRKDSYSSWHLHIILTEPDSIEGTVCIVVVNITTLRNDRRGLDTTVILDIGDHSFIDRPSVIAYRKAEFFHAQKLVSFINDENSLDDDLDDEILKRIRKGLLDSDFTPMDIWEYCKDEFDD
jgi:hypothetical protein